MRKLPSIATAGVLLGTAAFVPGTAVAADEGTITQITPEDGLSDIDSPDVSSNGRYVVYASHSATIVAHDDNDTSDVFLHDTTTGEDTLISHNAAGVAADGASGAPTISGNGKFIVFESVAGDLTPQGVGATDLLYRYNVATGDLRLVSKSHTGGFPNNSPGGGASVSANGRYVAYSTRSSNIVRGDHNRKADVFLYDAVLDQTTKVTQTAAGLETNGHAGQPEISNNGRFVTYWSQATNITADDATTRPDVYVFDSQAGTTTLASRKANGVATGGAPQAVSDGGIVVFVSNSGDLDPRDTSADTDAFVYRPNTGTVGLVSLTQPEAPVGAQVNAERPSISANGRYVVYTLSGADATAPNGYRSLVYLHDRTLNTTTLVNRGTGGGLPNGISYFARISASGNHVVYLSSATNLVPGGQPINTVDVFLWSRTVG